MKSKYEIKVTRTHLTIINNKGALYEIHFGENVEWFVQHLDGERASGYFDDGETVDNWIRFVEGN